MVWFCGVGKEKKRVCVFVEIERGKGLWDCVVVIKIKFFFFVLLGMGGR